MQSGGSLTYSSVLADMRTYLMPIRPYTIALRGMYYGRLGADGENEMLPTLYLGYPGLVRGYDQYSFEVERVRRRHRRVVPGLRSADWQPGRDRQRRAAIPHLGRLQQEPVLRTAPRSRARSLPTPASPGARASAPARRRATRRRSSASAPPFASTSSTSRWPRSTSSSRSTARRAAGCGSSSSGRDSRRRKGSACVDGGTEVAEFDTKDRSSRRRTKAVTLQRLARRPTAGAGDGSDTQIYKHFCCW